jgi:hypothetical protein
MSASTPETAVSGNGFPPQGTDPLSPGRTDIHPSDQPGIDELPENEGDVAEDEHPTPYEEGVPDMDPDNAEFDDQPNPR